jgi:hypothetical protein
MSVLAMVMNSPEALDLSAFAPGCHGHSFLARFLPVMSPTNHYVSLMDKRRYYVVITDKLASKSKITGGGWT